MTDEDALIAAYAESPNDVERRSVLADWFDEHDDPRGAWLRDPQLAPWMGPRAKHPACQLSWRMLLGDDVSGLLVRVGPTAVPYLLCRTAPEIPAAAAIVRTIRDAIPGLTAACEGLAASDVFERADVLRAVAAKGPAGLGDVLPYLRDSDDDVRVAALEAVAALGAADIAVWWAAQRSLSGDDDRLAELFAVAGREGTVTFLAQALPDDDPAVSRRASEEIVRLGPSVAGRVLHAFDDGVASKGRLVGTLVAFGPAVLPQLLEAAADSRRPWEVRCDAVAALADMRANGRLSPDDTRAAVACLVGILGQPLVTWGVAPALATFGADAALGVPALVGLLDSSEFGIDATEALARIGPAAAVALPDILAILRRPIDARRVAAARFAVAHGEADAVIAAVRESLSDPDPFVRAIAFDDLAPLPFCPGVAALVRAGLADPEPTVRKAAFEAVADRQALPPGVPADLIAGLRSSGAAGDEVERLAAVIQARADAGSLLGDTR